LHHQVLHISCPRVNLAMLSGLRRLALALASLTLLGLADRGGKEAIGSGAVQKLDSMQNTVEALQEKQNRVISKLEAEVHAAKTSSALGQWNAEVEAARSAVAAELESHLRALKAELQLLKSPEFPYAHFRQVGKFVEERSKKIGEAIDRMAPILPDMQQKSEEYQHNNFLLQQGVKHLEAKVIPDFFDKVGKEKSQEVHDMQWMDMNKAYTARDRKVLAEATQDDWNLIKHGQFKRTPDANFGANPYGSMSKEHWESDTSEWPAGFGPPAAEAKHANGPAATASLPLPGGTLSESGAIGPAATASSPLAGGSLSNEGDSPPAGTMSESVSPPEMAFVEVHPHSLKLRKNRTRAGK